MMVFSFFFFAVLLSFSAVALQSRSSHCGFNNACAQVVYVPMPPPGLPGVRAGAGEYIEEEIGSTSPSSEASEEVRFLSLLFAAPRPSLVFFLRSRLLVCRSEVSNDNWIGPTGSGSVCAYPRSVFR